MSLTHQSLPTPQIREKTPVPAALSSSLYPEKAEKASESTPDALLYTHGSAGSGEQSPGPMEVRYTTLACSSRTFACVSSTKRARSAEIQSATCKLKVPRSPTFISGTSNV